LLYLAHIHGGTILTRRKKEKEKEKDKGVGIGIEGRERRKERREAGGVGDMLVAVYYLLLQDRVDKARELFGEVEKTVEKRRKKEGNTVEMEIQYDYIAAYLDFFSSVAESTSSSSSFSSSSSPEENLVPPLTVARVYVDAYVGECV
jgi:hypothetical protein